MVTLTYNEISWLWKVQPGLTYIHGANLLAGTFKFTAQYRTLEKITDSYDLVIRFTSNGILPEVYETRGKIARMAKIAGKQIGDFHVNSDGTLCMIREDKVYSIYKNGFDLKLFINHLMTHFYWISYYGIYGKEPWIAEEHGYGYLLNKLLWTKRL
ncbi:hypothetical protein [Phocaeicola paurosaccharolyticus]|uniref:hypothetical protein n=1 Tax=Phocaeicola paurosaccharolyticus TaxID=732242 RepID=UPI000469415C|nr:hypothetical protein [Phocaeicola paurosaccharolyticus]